MSLGRILSMKERGEIEDVLSRNSVIKGGFCPNLEFYSLEGDLKKNVLVTREYEIPS